jgi:hypothetical protein
MKRINLYLCILIILLAACTPEPTGDQTSLSATATATNPQTGIGTPTQTLRAGETPMLKPSVTATLGPEEWKTFPVIPEEVSQRMVEVYQRGLARGREPDRFSKFGDCQSVPSLFLAMYDEGTYQLGGEYAYLQTTIDYFADSWSRESLAVKGGLNVAAVQTLYYTDPEHCELTESPMVCEIRVHNPSIVLISFETWWADKPTSGYDDRLRAVVEYVLSQDVVPILATKADNVEGDHSINAAIARIAYDYQIPLWNFWAAANALPSRGLADGFHLTFAQNFFDDPERMEMAWPWRNLTALQSIDAIHRALNTLP